MASGEWLRFNLFKGIKRWDVCLWGGGVSSLPIHKRPDLLQLNVTSSRIRPAGTAGHPSPSSSRATSRPPSPDGSWAGTTSTGAATPWSARWPNWQSELSADARLLPARPFITPPLFNLFFSFSFDPRSPDSLVSLVSRVKAKETTQRKQDNWCLAPLPVTPSTPSLIQKDTKRSDASYIYFFSHLCPEKAVTNRCCLYVLWDPSPTISIKPHFQFHPGCVFP